MLFLQGAQYIVPTAISFIIVLVFAFAYHEFAHALVADRLGDPTPRSAGRITINPLAHLDRTGLFMALIFGFGFAVTPVNPRYMRGNPRVSMAFVAVAGPLANLFMAVLYGLPIFLGLVEVSLPGRYLPSLYSFLSFGVYFNLLLFVLNLMPIPPLDGFTILLGVLPPELAYRLQPLQSYGFLPFLLVFFILPLLRINIATEIIYSGIGFIYPLILGGQLPLFI